MIDLYKYTYVRITSITLMNPQQDSLIAIYALYHTGVPRLFYRGGDELRKLYIYKHMNY